MSPVLIIDWKGAAFDVLRPWIADRKLPNLACLVEAGAHGALRAAPMEHRSTDVWQALRGAGRRVIFASADSREFLAAARRLMQDGAWDCVKIAFSQPQSATSGDSLLAVYQELDRQMAELTPLLSKEATLVLLSAATQPVRGLADPCGPAPDRGIFLACGASIRAGIEVAGGSIDDVARTVLHLLDIPAPEGAEGRVLDELFVIDQSVEDERIVAERLRSLGYIE